MGEARRRSDQGLAPRQKKSQKDDSPRIFAWLPITHKQKDQFYAITTRGAWIGMGLMVVYWIVGRFVGPAAGWWGPSDVR